MTLGTEDSAGTILGGVLHGATLITDRDGHLHHFLLIINHIGMYIMDAESLVLHTILLCNKVQEISEGAAVTHVETRI